VPHDHGFVIDEFEDYEAWPHFLNALQRLLLAS
jgi:hypothetical protein